MSSSVICDLGLAPTPRRVGFGKGPSGKRERSKALLTSDDGKVRLGGFLPCSKEGCCSKSRI
jgi:hypothetical protein